MNDPAVPQTTPVGSQNDQNKELANAGLTGVNVEPRPPEEAASGLSTQPLAENSSIDTDPLTAGSEDTGNFAPVQKNEINPTGNNPAVEISANPSAANPIPAIQVNDNTIPTVEQPQDTVGNTSPHQDEILNQNPNTPTTPAVNSASLDSQSPAQPEGFMAKFLSIFKK
jgi:hypothetical protein